ncbi:two-component regulator propeller domain-containing protein [Larkinella knui]|uniref:histidine kinase n=1 Tax=Larkinella knui TaxID=2025310 RepID=A0A3P1CXE7_9BACT|nr:response regulator [Larkinella knui]RRB18011.1 response regulator [Larkinella knui]
MRFLYLFFFFPITLLAQPKGWQEITISDGLSQGMIYNLRQDQKGFIWIGTKDGLNRYDGHNFKVFTHDPYNPYSISEDYCNTLLIDRHQRLWVGTLNQGLNLFDNRTQRFYRISIGDQATLNAGNYEILALAEDPAGNIWVGTNQNLIFKISLPASLRTGFPDRPDFTALVHLERIPINQKKSTSPTCYFNFRPDGRAFLGTGSGLFSFNWQRPANATRLALFSDGPLDFHTWYAAPRQDFWFVATGDYILGSHQGVTKVIPLPHKNYFGVRLSGIDTQTVAIATPDHLWLMSPGELFRQDSLRIPDAYVALPPNLSTITSLLKDKTGSIWAGTSGYGLRKFNPRIKQFQAYVPNTSLTNLYVDRQGRTYVRYQYAYGQLDRKHNRLTDFLDPNLPEADRRQRNLFQDRKGFFWVSNTHFQNHQHTLFKFSPDWGLIKKYPLPPNTGFGFVGNQTVETPDGTLLIGVNTGKLLRFNPVTETFDVLSYQHLLPKTGAETETFVLHQDRSGTVWIGTQKGLVKAKSPLSNPVFTLYKNNLNDRRSLSNDFVSSLVDDPDQPDRYLWVGTKGGGLNRMDKQTGQFENLGEAQGLPNKVVYGILVDGFKNFWLSTNRGLAQFNPKTRQFRNYTKADGLQDDEFNTGSFFKAPSGELLFGGINGLTAFRAEDVAGKTNQKPLVNIIGLKINNETVDVGGADHLLSEGIEYTRRLDLAHNQNLVTLEFGVMDYTNSAKNRYRYRLAGIDRDWVEAGTNRFANYAQLPDGDYRFAMMGSADGQVWSDPVELQIRLHPPFYRTWWAYLLYAMLLAVVGWQLYRFQTQRWLLQQQVIFEQNEASRLAELDALKTQFFTNISHEFRTPLTLILGPIEQLTQEYAQDARFPLLQRNANRLLNLINQLLDLSKLEAGQMKSETVEGDITAFFRTLASSFSSLAENRFIQFSFGQNATELWADFDRDKIEKIVSNLLANAFKFTPAGKAVRMEIDYSAQSLENTLILTIQDTGIGMNSAHLEHIFERFYQIDQNIGRTVYEGTGIGLALVNELVKVLKGTIRVTSTEGIGTAFTVTLPLRIMTRPEPVLTPAGASAVVDPGWFETPARVDDHPRNEVTENCLLIIDDNADIRAYVRSIFETDYAIIEAVDGQEGLEKATAMLPDLVICDLMMPRLDGYGFCRTLKTQAATSHIPVVMLTAKAAVENRIEGFELGADDYLTKPFNRDEIRARVWNLLQKQARLRHFFGGPPNGPVPVSDPGQLKEQAFLLKAIAVIEQHLAESTFSVEQLSEALNLSQRQLVRKLKALTDQTGVEFIRNRRLERAAVVLRQGNHTVSEVAYQVGFESLSYFTRVFQDKYGVLPSAFTQT